MAKKNNVVGCVDIKIHNHLGDRSSIFWVSMSRIIIIIDIGYFCAIPLFSSGQFPSGYYGEDYCGNNIFTACV